MVGGEGGEGDGEENDDDEVLSEEDGIELVQHGSNKASPKSLGTTWKPTRRPKFHPYHFLIGIPLIVTMAVVVLLIPN